jgi:hypothetical protein
VDTGNAANLTGGDHSEGTKGAQRLEEPIWD